jgi:hypothetical protein
MFASLHVTACRWTNLESVRQHWITSILASLVLRAYQLSTQKRHFIRGDIWNEHKISMYSRSVERSDALIMTSHNAEMQACKSGNPTPLCQKTLPAILMHLLPKCCSAVLMVCRIRERSLYQRLQWPQHAQDQRQLRL